MNQDNETLILNNPNSTDEELEELFAIKALIINPQMILSNVMAFNNFCWAVNDIIPNVEAFDPPNLLMVAHAIQKIEEVLGKKPLFLEPHEHTTIVFIANIGFDEGWVILPSILYFAQKELDKLTSDYAKELFHGITVEYLLKTEPWDDDDPISNACAKMQTVQHYLRVMGEK